MSYNESVNTEDPWEQSVGHRRKVFKAFCNSFQCVGKNPRKVEKKVKKGTSHCPDCGEALLWDYAGEGNV